MSCIAPPHVGLDLPGLNLLLPTITLPTIGVGVDLCCEFDYSLPLPPINLQPLINALKTLVGGTFAPIEAILLLIDQATDQLNALLDQLTFDCPLS